MIELGTYTREQLFTLLDCRGLSYAKKKLDNQGYKYITNNKKGNNYRLTITAVPVPAASDIFRKCCKDDLHITNNIDFDKLAILVCFLEYDANFVDLTLEQMEKRIKDCGYIISRQTIAKYLEVFEANNILVTFYGEYIYYVPLDTTRFITREEWLEFWDACYNNKILYDCLLKELGSRPYKRYKRYFGNALVPAYYTLVEHATTIVKEIRDNELASIH